MFLKSAEKSVRQAENTGWVVGSRDVRYTRDVEEPQDAGSPWLLLVHQLPTHPSRVRVKIWRRLQSVGAVAVKSSVYVLPDSSEAREDFEWIRAEIVAQGGEAIVLVARTADEQSAAEIRDALVNARQSDWQELTEKCREVLASHASSGSIADGAVGDLQRELRSLRARAARIEQIDYFKVSGRRDALAALQQIERLLDPESGAVAEGAPRKQVEDYQGRVWLTRPRPGVDRMSSAWLIRRFIDSGATFRFAEKVSKTSDVVPFDMFGVDLGHRGERVTFEAFMADFGLSDPALSRIARIVHELDLKADAVTDAEGPTVESLIEGLRASFDNDDQLLDHGIALFEALYASFSRSKV